MMIKKITICFLLLFGYNLQASDESEFLKAIQVKEFKKVCNDLEQQYEKKWQAEEIKIQVLQEINNDLEQKVIKRQRDLEAIKAGRIPSPETVDSSISENEEMIELQSKIKQNYKTLAIINTAIESTQATQTAYQNYMAVKKNHLYS